jgi:hypothetical protein
LFEAELSKLKAQDLKSREVCGLGLELIKIFICKCTVVRLILVVA